jgi:hypothetical protein
MKSSLKDLLGEGGLHKGMVSVVERAELFSDRKSFKVLSTSTPRRRLEDNFNIDLKVIGCEDSYCSE